MQTVIKPDFSVSETIAESWKKVSGSKLAYFKALVAVICAVIFFMLLEVILRVVLGENLLLRILLEILRVIVQLCLGAGILVLGLRRTLNMPLDTKHLLDPLTRLWPLALAAVLQTLVYMSPGLLFIPIYFIGLGPLAIVLGVLAVCLMLYALIALAFVQPLVLAGQHAPARAVMLSIAGTSRHCFRVLLLFIVNGLACLAGALTLGIGLIWALPFTINTIAVAYARIFGLEREKLEAIVYWR